MFSPSVMNKETSGRTVTGSFTGSQTVKPEKKKMNETLRNKIPFYTGEDRN